MSGGILAGIAATLVAVATVQQLSDPTNPANNPGIHVTTCEEIAVRHAKSGYPIPPDTKKRCDWYNNKPEQPMNPASKEAKAFVKYHCARTLSGHVLDPVSGKVLGYCKPKGVRKDSTFGEL